MFTRTCTIRNASPRPTTEIVVLDQVPVSEDEKLKIEILRPQGLTVAGNNVVKADAVLSGAHREKGSATASVKKDSQVVWKVALEGNMTVTLNLQYEATFPKGERIR